MYDGYEWGKNNDIEILPDKLMSYRTLSVHKASCQKSSDLYLTL